MASSISMEITSVESSSHTLITTHKLNGNNYIQWSQSVRMFICGKGKDEFLSSQNEQPKITDLEFQKWKVDNMVMSWLINSMTNEIGENFLLYETAHRFWDVVKETFSSKENALELSRIESVFAKVISLLRNILIISLVIVNALIYLNSIHGRVLVMLLNTRKFLKRREPSNFSLALTMIWMKFERESWELSHYQVYVKPFQKYGEKKVERVK